MEEPTKLKKRISIIGNMIKNEDGDVKKLKKLKKKYEDKLEELTGGLTISDHALLRYLQRVLEIDVESVRWNLLKIIKNAYKGNGSYPLGNELYAIIKNKTVATIIKGKTEFKNHRGY